MMKFSVKELRVVCILWLVSKSDGGLIQLGRMVRYINDGAQLLDLARYGNYCGVGGQGMPLDAVDRCCKEHDRCFSRVMNEFCKGVYGLLVPYKWSKVTNNNNEKDANCDRNVIECSKNVCECDRQLSFCFRDMSKAYREEHVRGEKGLLGVFT